LNYTRKGGNFTWVNNNTQTQFFDSGTRTVTTVACDCVVMVDDSFLQCGPHGENTLG